MVLQNPSHRSCNLWISFKDNFKIDFLCFGPIFVPSFPFWWKSVSSLNTTRAVRFSVCTRYLLLLRRFKTCSLLYFQMSILDLLSIFKCCFGTGKYRLYSLSLLKFIYSLFNTRFRDSEARRFRNG